jgi:hypothetical protein
MQKQVITNTAAKMEPASDREIDPPHLTPGMSYHHLGCAFLAAHAVQPGRMITHPCRNRRSKTPSFTHRWNVRRTELSSGNSLGRRFHWHPLRKRKMIASSALRGSVRVRPVRFGGTSSSKTRSTTH